MTTQSMHYYLDRSATSIPLAEFITVLANKGLRRFKQALQSVLAYGVQFRAFVANRHKHITAEHSQLYTSLQDRKWLLICT
jgi:hypothetical protein